MAHESSRKILVVEDDAITRNIFLDGLEAEGFDAIGAENGIIGIQQAQKHLPELVICDILMPEMNGFEVLAALRQNPLTAITPFIFLAGSNMKADIRKGMDLGADDYLTKPATVEELLRAITARLEKQAQVIQHWYGICCQNPPQSSSATTTPLRNSQSFFPSLPHLKEVFDFIEANYDQGITLCHVAEAVGYSPAYLTNRVAKQTGETVNGWIVKRRMAAARSLLQDTSKTIEQISTIVGYQNACHFSRQFRQHHGIPPQTWRREHQLLSIAKSA